MDGVGSGVVDEVGSIVGSGWGVMLVGAVASGCGSGAGVGSVNVSGFGRSDSGISSSRRATVEVPPPLSTEDGTVLAFAIRGDAGSGCLPASQKPTPTTTMIKPPTLPPNKIAPRAPPELDFARAVAVRLRFSFGASSISCVSGAAKGWAASIGLATGAAGIGGGVATGMPAGCIGAIGDCAAGIAWGNGAAGAKGAIGLGIACGITGATGTAFATGAIGFGAADPSGAGCK